MDLTAAAYAYGEYVVRASACAGEDDELPEVHAAVFAVYADGSSGDGAPVELLRDAVGGRGGYGLGEVPEPYEPDVAGRPGWMDAGTGLGACFRPERLGYVRG